MSCELHLRIIQGWDPDTEDLPDETALHLDECEACRAAFDARFGPVDLPVQEVPEGLAERVGPTVSRRLTPLWMGLGLAAALVLSIGGLAVVGGSMMVLSSGREISKYEVAKAPPTMSEAGAEALRSLGYVDTHIPYEGSSGSRVAYRDPDTAPPAEVALAPTRTSASPARTELRIYSGSREREYTFDGDGGGDAGFEIMWGSQEETEIPTGEEYQDHGTLGWVRSSEDPLSTFAADVDTASYTITRSKLRQGWLPPAEAVRVEEFVNYLPYEYTPPTEAPFSVNMEAVPSPFHTGRHLVRVGVQGQKISVFDRKPVHLTFLVDTSGSMQSSDRLPLAVYALQELVGELRDGDTVAIVSYAGSAGLVLAPTPVSQEELILSKLSTLTAGGSTAMGQGIQLAYDLADQTYARGAVNRVVILSDGDANVGPSSRGALTAMVKEHAGRGITLTTLGFGSGNYKDATMERLADEGDGNYFYVDSQQEARRVFVDRLTGTMQVIARDVKLQIEFDPEAVLMWRQVGYENRQVADRDFRNDAVDAGEIGAGHQVTALYEVQLAPGSSGELAVVRVRAKPPGPDAPAREWRTTLRSEDVRPSFEEGSRDTRMAVAVAAFAEVLRASPWMEGTSIARLEAMARRAHRPEYDEHVELLELMEEARQIQQRGGQIPR